MRCKQFKMQHCLSVLLASNTEPLPTGREKCTTSSTHLTTVVYLILSISSFIANDSTNWMNFASLRWHCPVMQNTSSINFNVAYFSIFGILIVIFTITLYPMFVRRGFPFSIFFCEPISLPEDGWNGQPKPVVALNKNKYTRSTQMCCS